MDDSTPDTNQFDWVESGPPYGDVDASPDWDDTPEQATVTEPPAVPDRYVSLSLERSCIVIYDRAETHAWIQSTVVTPLREYGDTQETRVDEADPNRD